MTNRCLVRLSYSVTKINVVLLIIRYDLLIKAIIINSNRFKKSNQIKSSEISLTYN